MTTAGVFKKYKASKRDNLKRLEFSIYNFYPELGKGTPEEKAIRRIKLIEQLELRTPKVRLERNEGLLGNQETTKQNNNDTIAEKRDSVAVVVKLAKETNDKKNLKRKSVSFLSEIITASHTYPSSERSDSESLLYKEFIPHKKRRSMARRGRKRKSRAEKNSSLQKPLLNDNNFTDSNEDTASGSNSIVAAPDITSPEYENAKPNGRIGGITDEEDKEIETICGEVFQIANEMPQPQMPMPMPMPTPKTPSPTMKNCQGKPRKRQLKDPLEAKTSKKPRNIRPKKKSNLADYVEQFSKNCSNFSSTGSDDELQCTTSEGDIEPDLSADQTVEIDSLGTGVANALLEQTIDQQKIQGYANFLVGPDGKLQMAPIGGIVSDVVLPQPRTGVDDALVGRESPQIYELHSLSTSENNATVGGKVHYLTRVMETESVMPANLATGEPMLKSAAAGDFGNSMDPTATPGVIQIRSIVSDCTATLKPIPDGVISIPDLTNISINLPSQIADPSESAGLEQPDGGKQLNDKQPTEATTNTTTASQRNDSLFVLQSPHIPLQNGTYVQNLSDHDNPPQSNGNGPPPNENHHSDNFLIRFQVAPTSQSDNAGRYQSGVPDIPQMPTQSTPIPPQFNQYQQPQAPSVYPPQSAQISQQFDQYQQPQPPSVYPPQSAPISQQFNQYQQPQPVSVYAPQSAPVPQQFNQYQQPQPSSVYPPQSAPISQQYNQYQQPQPLSVCPPQSAPIHQQYNQYQQPQPLSVYPSQSAPIHQQYNQYQQPQPLPVYPSQSAPIHKQFNQYQHPPPTYPMNNRSSNRSGEYNITGSRRQQQARPRRYRRYKCLRCGSRDLILDYSPSPPSEGAAPHSRGPDCAAPHYDRRYPPPPSLSNAWESNPPYVVQPQPPPASVVYRPYAPRNRYAPPNRMYPQAHPPPPSQPKPLHHPAPVVRIASKSATMASPKPPTPALTFAAAPEGNKTLDQPNAPPAAENTNYEVTLQSANVGRSMPDLYDDVIVNNDKNNSQSAAGETNKGSHLETTTELNDPPMLDDSAAAKFIEQIVSGNFEIIDPPVSIVFDPADNRKSCVKEAEGEAFDSQIYTLPSINCIESDNNVVTDAATRPTDYLDRRTEQCEDIEVFTVDFVRDIDQQIEAMNNEKEHQNKNASNETERPAVAVTPKQNSVTTKKWKGKDIEILKIEYVSSVLSKPKNDSSSRGSVNDSDSADSDLKSSSSSCDDKLKGTVQRNWSPLADQSTRPSYGLEREKQNIDLSPESLILTNLLKSPVKKFYPPSPGIEVTEDAHKNKNVVIPISPSNGCFFPSISSPDEDVLNAQTSSRILPDISKIVEDITITQGHKHPPQSSPAGPLGGKLSPRKPVNDNSRLIPVMRKDLRNRPLTNKKPLMVKLKKMLRKTPLIKWPVQKSQQPVQKSPPPVLQKSLQKSSGLEPPLQKSPPLKCPVLKLARSKMLAPMQKPSVQNPPIQKPLFPKQPVSNCNGKNSLIRKDLQKITNEKESEEEHTPRVRRSTSVDATTKVMKLQNLSQIDENSPRFSKTRETTTHSRILPYSPGTPFGKIMRDHTPSRENTQFDLTPTCSVSSDDMWWLDGNLSMTIECPSTPQSYDSNIETPQCSVMGSPASMLPESSDFNRNLSPTASGDIASQASEAINEEEHLAGKRAGQGSADVSLPPIIICRGGDIISLAPTTYEFDDDTGNVELKTPDDQKQNHEIKKTSKKELKSSSNSSKRSRPASPHIDLKFDLLKIEPSLEVDFQPDFESPHSSDESPARWQSPFRSVSLSSDNRTSETEKNNAASERNSIESEFAEGKTMEEENGNVESECVENSAVGNKAVESDIVVGKDVESDVVMDDIQIEAATDKDMVSKSEGVKIVEFKSLEDGEIVSSDSEGDGGQQRAMALLGRGEYSNEGGEGCSYFMSNTEIAGYFNVSCFPFLAQNCPLAPTNQHNHNLPEAQLVLERLAAVDSVQLGYAYRFVNNHSLLFDNYFSVFCDLYAIKNNRKKLVNMIADCERHGIERSHYLIPIYKSLMKTGLNRADACRMLLLQSRDRSPHTIAIIMKIISFSDWTNFTPFVRNFVQQPGVMLSIDIIRDMAPAVLERPELSEIFFQSLGQLRADDFELVAQCPEILQVIQASAGVL